MNVATHLASSDRAARRLFTGAASAAGLALQTCSHPLPGVDGKALAMMVARIGVLETPALSPIGSAGNGVEDHCASERKSFSGMPEQRAKSL